MPQLILKKNELAPIALFCFNRVTHLKRCVSSLKSSPYSRFSELIIFSDAAKNNYQKESVKEVREFIRTIKGFKKISIVERKKNFGLAKSIIEGVKQVLKNHSTIIVIEDDLIVAKNFLYFMNLFLKKYKNKEEVISIHGFLFPLERKVQHNFFIVGADCWGWATWQRGWKVFNPDSKYLLDQLERKKLLWKFDYEGTANYTSMLRDNIKGLNDSWAVRWHASAVINDMLTLYPRESLVINIGNDGSGVHSIKTNAYDVSFGNRKIDTSSPIIKECSDNRALIRKYFLRQQKNMIYAIVKRILKWIENEVKRISKAVSFR